MVPPHLAAGLPFPKGVFGHNHTRLMPTMSSRFRKEIPMLQIRSRMRLVFFLHLGILSALVLCSCQTARTIPIGAVSAPAKAVTSKPAATKQTPANPVNSVPIKTPPAESTSTAGVLVVPSLLNQVAARLKPVYSTTTICSYPCTEILRIVKPTSRQTQSSLFEESIILAKLRGLLDSGPAPARNANLTFQNGSAALNLPDSIQPGPAADLIKKMLSIEGVNAMELSFAR